MPNQPQNSGQGQARQNGGAAAGAQQAVRDAGQKLQEGAAQVGQHVQEHLGAAKEQAAHGYRQAEGLVARNPSQSLLVGFGVGVGLGVLLAALLTREEERPWYDRYADRLRGLPDYARDHLGHLPEYARDHLHSAHKTIRQGVEEVSRRLPDSLRH